MNVRTFARGLGLVFTVVVQTIGQKRATMRKARLLNELAMARVAAAKSEVARQAVDQMYTQISEQMVDGEAKTADLRRQSLKRTLAFYEGMQADRIDARSAGRARERAQQIRAELEDDTEERPEAKSDGLH